MTGKPSTQSMGIGWQPLAQRGAVEYRCRKEQSVTDTVSIVAAEAQWPVKPLRRVR
jgi:hypothetical protein